MQKTTELSLDTSRMNNQAVLFFNAENYRVISSSHQSNNQGKQTSQKLVQSEDTDIIIHNQDFHLSGA